MAQEGKEDPLAYGEYHDQRQGESEGDFQEGERGFVGDTFRRLRGRYHGQSDTGSSHDQSHGQASQPLAPNGGHEQPGGLGSSLFNKLHGAVHGLSSEIKQHLENRPPSSQDRPGLVGVQGTSEGTHYRYGSFAQQRRGNDAKWYVDGCGYMWAVSVALEQAKESIWILDCRFTPLIYQSVNILQHH